MRDFYRAASQPGAPEVVPSAAAIDAPVSNSFGAQAAHATAARAAETQFDDFDYGTSNNPSIPNLIPYLQRLSSDGEQAFGLWDSASGFSVFSANFERVCGLSSAQCAGHDWIGAIHNDQQYALNEALCQAEQAHHASQCLVQARQGEGWAWLLVEVKPPAPNQHAVMVLWRNVSELHALNETLKQTQAALAVSERGRAAFLSSMSHELRTPLNAIMGFSEMMQSGVFGKLENSTYQQYAQHIHESGKLLLNKVADLIDIASLNAGARDMDEQECNARQLLQEVIEMHSHAAFARGQQLKLDCPQAITLRADRAKLVCVLSHFVSNATRHSPDNAEVTLSARAVPHDGVIFSVRDAGEGIPPAQLQTIRDALQVEESYFEIAPGGIGLGLSLSRELAARHGGRVLVDSIRHRGTVASLILPPERVLSGLPQKHRRHN